MVPCCNQSGGTSKPMAVAGSPPEAGSKPAHLMTKPPDFVTTATGRRWRSSWRASRSRLLLIWTAFAVLVPYRSGDGAATPDFTGLRKYFSRPLGLQAESALAT